MHQLAIIAYDAFSGDGTLRHKLSGDTFDSIQIDKNDGGILNTLNLNDTLILVFS